MKNLELERTFLARYLPDDLTKFSSREICDVYIKNKSGYYNLRLRKNGGKYSITRKERIDNNDASRQMEYTISLVEEEFEQLASFSAKRLCKKRFDYVFDNIKIEFDVFSGDLRGLVLIDVEFKDEKAKDSFVIPDFCLADVTQEDFVAGGFLFFSSYRDIEVYLQKYNYAKLI